MRSRGGSPGLPGPLRGDRNRATRNGSKVLCRATCTARLFLVVFKCHSPRPRREPSSESWTLGSPEVPAPGTRGRPRTGEPCCPERAVLADSGSPDAPGGRAAGPRALDGVDGAGWGTKAHALKFKSSESGPRICMLTMSQVRR